LVNKPVLELMELDDVGLEGEATNAEGKALKRYTGTGARRGNRGTRGRTRHFEEVSRFGWYLMYLASLRKTKHSVEQSQECSSHRQPHCRMTRQQQDPWRSVRNQHDMTAL
jgi:hypothetical protein